MPILDQLRKEADTKRESEFAEANAKQQLDDEYKNNILPKMQKTYIFLKEIVEHLSYLEKAIEIADYSRDYPQIGALTQTDYKINTDGFGGLADFNRIMQINVLFSLVGQGSFSYSVEGKTRIEQEIAYLISKNLKPDWNQFINASGIETASFTVNRKIPVRFRFEVDYPNSKIKLLIHNHENFNVYKKTFEPNQITDSLLDEVIRFMLRKDSDFILLDIGSQDKQRIQQKAEEEQLRWVKQLEELRIEEAKDKEEPPTNENAFFNRIKAIANKKIL